MAVFFRRWLISALVTVMAVMAAPDARAQEVNRIVAVVNDEAITAIELEMRLRLTLLSSNLPDNAEVRRRVLPQTLRKLIEERLQVQEAGRLKANVGKEEIAGAIANVERQNRMPPGGLTRMLKEAGISQSTVERQAEAELAWRKIVRLQMKQRVKIGDDDVNDRLDMLRASLGQPEYLMAEILLTVDEPDNEAEVVRLADRILDQLRQGAQFPALAREFSQSASAANGGNLNWVPGATLAPELAKAVAQMQTGTVAGPIRTDEGLQIVLLRDRRIAGQSGGGDAAVALAQALIPAASDRALARKQADELAGSLKSCADFDRAAKEHELPQSGRIGTIQVKDLPEKLRSVVATLDVMQKSPVLEEPAGFRIVMVCGKSGGDGGGLPSAEEIRNQLENERTDLVARGYLRDLRRAAFVEVRL